MGSVFVPLQAMAFYVSFNLLAAALGRLYRMVLAGKSSWDFSPAGVAGSNPTSEFVRQELRAVVGARTAQSQPAGQRPGPSAAQQLQQQLGQQGTVDLESLGISFEMPSGKLLQWKARHHFVDT